MQRGRLNVDIAYGVDMRCLQLLSFDRRAMLHVHRIEYCTFLVTLDQHEQLQMDTWIAPLFSIDHTITLNQLHVHAQTRYSDVAPGPCTEYKTPLVATIMLIGSSGKPLLSCPVSVSSYWPNVSDRQYSVPTISPNWNADGWATFPITNNHTARKEEMNRETKARYPELPTSLFRIGLEWGKDVELNVWL